jgi:hypothetical protein
MQRYLATLTIVLLLGIVLARVAMLRRQGVLGQAVSRARLADEQTISAPHWHGSTTTEIAATRAILGVVGSLTSHG